VEVETIFLTDDLLFFQEKIDSYRQNFSDRAGGFELPKVEYLGRFQFATKVETENEVFISIPVKNQESIIEKVLMSLSQNIGMNYSIGLLFDNCTDNSLQASFDVIKSKLVMDPYIKKVYILKSYDELFESTCENILFKFCENNFFVSLQADIYFYDLTFLNRAINAFLKIPELFALSGKAIVPFKIVSPKKKLVSRIIKLLTQPIIVSSSLSSRIKLGINRSYLQYFGDLSQSPYSEMVFTNKQLATVNFGEAVIRGPVIWRSILFQRFKGFDDVAFYLGRDDCDLSFRAFLDGYRVGYLPCKFKSFYEEGTTRKIRTPAVISALNDRNNLAKQFPGKLHQFWSDNLQQGMSNKLTFYKNYWGRSHKFSIVLKDKS